MGKIVELRDIVFDNVEMVLNLTPHENQQRLCEPVAKTIAMAYAGNNEGYPGFLQAIYCNETPVGIILVGRSLVGEDEAEVLQGYEYVYRIWNLFIDKNYQSRGIGRAALGLALEKLREYPKAGQVPIYLECHIENKVALALYESLGFQSIDVTFRDGYCALVQFPK